MSSKITNSCQVKPSIIGAKGFFYPSDEYTGLYVKKGTVVETLSYLSGKNDNRLQAVAISNSAVEGSIIQDGTSIYWVDRKNIS